jgi:hypothetical protein
MVLPVLLSLCSRGVPGMLYHHITVPVDIQPGAGAVGRRRYRTGTSDWSLLNYVDAYMHHVKFL